MITGEIRSKSTPSERFWTAGISNPRGGGRTDDDFRCSRFKHFEPKDRHALARVARFRQFRSSFVSAKA